MAGRDRRCRPGCLPGSTGWLRTAGLGIARPCWCSVATRALWRCARRGLSVDPAAPAESGEAAGLPEAPLRSTEPARWTEPARAMAESERATARRADTAWAAAGRAG